MTPFQRARDRAAENAPSMADLTAEVAEFFHLEAELLDDWRLDEWLGLLDTDISYLVHPLDVRQDDPSKALFLVSDDRARVESRVAQLLGRTAWAENPRSRTRRLVTNVRAGLEPDGAVRGDANFAVYRFKNDQSDVYIGRYRYLLVRTEVGLRLKERSVILDLEALRPQGKLSFIL